MKLVVRIILICGILIPVSLVGQKRGDSFTQKDRHEFYQQICTEIDFKSKFGAYTGYTLTSEDLIIKIRYKPGEPIYFIDTTKTCSNYFHVTLMVRLEIDYFVDLITYAIDPKQYKIWKMHISENHDDYNYDYEIRRLSPVELSKKKVKKMVRLLE